MGPGGQRLGRPIQRCLVTAPVRRCLRTSSSTYNSSARESSRSSYGTSPSIQARYPAESPRFILIPQPVQAQAPQHTIIKGKLPVPRPIITAHGPDKCSESYLNAATPKPLDHNTYNPQHHSDTAVSERMAHKARQAILRRENLRSSLNELRLRKVAQDRTIAESSARKIASNAARRTAAERDDIVLTSTTIIPQDANPGVGATRKQRHVANTAALKALDGDETSLALKRANVAAMQAKHETRRGDMLHDLYVNAGTFITTEADLDAALEKAFDDPRLFINDNVIGVNIWNKGTPETTEELLGTKRGQTRDRAALDGFKSTEQVMRVRLDKVGQELTGGMDIDLNS